MSESYPTASTTIPSSTESNPPTKRRRIDEEDEVEEEKEQDTQQESPFYYDDSSTDLTSLHFDPMIGDSPFLSVVRQEYLALNHRQLTMSIVPFWPLVGSSKSVRSCYHEGLLKGLQGVHIRFLLSQLQSQASTNILLDPLIPYAPLRIEKDIVDELFGWGIPFKDCENIVASLTIDMANASIDCARRRNELRKEISSKASSVSPSSNTVLPDVLPLRGNLKIIPMQQQRTIMNTGTTTFMKRDEDNSDSNSAIPLTSLSSCSPDIPLTIANNTVEDIPLPNTLSTGIPVSDDYSIEENTPLLLVYEPDAIEVQKWLIPVRSMVPLPSDTTFYGSLNMPLYSAIDQPGVRESLMVHNIPVTPFTSVLILRTFHLEKLSILYRLTKTGTTTLTELQEKEIHSSTTKLTSSSSSALSHLSSFTMDTDFLQRVYCMVARYETFSGNASGLQGALPHHIFDSLENTLAIHTECFASPLNTHFTQYCSAFPDTDIPFGSLGSFYDYNPKDNEAYEANPPFVNETMFTMTKRLETLLDQAQILNKSLLYFVVVPTWSDAVFHQALETGKFTRIMGKRLRRTKHHEYIDGMQHRSNTSTTWNANMNSSWFILATDKAAKTIEDKQIIGIETRTDTVSSVTYETVRKKIREAFSKTTVDPYDRVLKYYPLPKVDLFLQKEE